MFIGIDIIEINRIEQAIKEQGDKFLDRIYTKPEIEKYAGLPQSLAARFAAKEAVIKALDAAGKGISYKNIEVLAEPSGKPVIILHQRAKAARRQSWALQASPSASPIRKIMRWRWWPESNHFYLSLFC